MTDYNGQDNFKENLPLDKNRNESPDAGVTNGDSISDFHSEDRTHQVEGVISSQWSNWNFTDEMNQPSHNGSIDHPVNLNGSPIDHDSSPSPNSQPDQDTTGKKESFSSLDSSVTISQTENLTDTKYPNHSPYGSNNYSSLDSESNQKSFVSSNSSSPALPVERAELLPEEQNLNNLTSSYGGESNNTLIDNSLKQESFISDTFSSSAVPVQSAVTLPEERENFSSPYYRGYTHPQTETSSVESSGNNISSDKPSSGIYQTENLGHVISQSSDVSAHLPNYVGNTPQDSAVHNRYQYANDNYNSSTTFTKEDEGAKNFKPPEQFRENSSEPVKQSKKKSGIKGSLVAALLFVSLLAGAAGGGGVAYALVSNNSTNVVASTTNSNGSKTGVNSVLTGTTLSASTDVSNVVSNVADTVVEVTTESVAKNPFLGDYVTDGAGSGVIISEDGYIVTNNHVIDGATAIKIRTCDGSEYEAQLVGTDAQTDIAVLKVDATGFHAAEFGDSDTAVVGETAIAIGNPLGTLGGTVTTGIVSALDREIAIDNETMHLMQFSAAVNPGNSGGGLFDINGNLIGIVNAKSSGSGIEGLGFAIPVNAAQAVIESLQENGYVTGRPELGIKVLEINEARTASYYNVSEYGVYVAETADNGLELGDRIISIDEDPIESYTDIQAVLQNHSAGDVLTIEVDREGTNKKIDVTLGEKVPDYIKNQQGTTVTA